MALIIGEADEEADVERMGRLRVTKLGQKGSTQLDE